MRSLVRSCVGGGTALFAIPSALATEPAAAPAFHSAESRIVSSEPDSHVSKNDAPLSSVELDGYRGGQTTVAGFQTLSAVTTGNVLNGDFIGGSITLSGNALANFNGIGNFAINTGAQVSLQSAMNLTVNVVP